MKKIILGLLAVSLLSLDLSGCAKKPKPEEPLIAFLDAFKAKEIIDYQTFFDREVTTDFTGSPFESSDTPSEISDKMMEMMLSYEYEVVNTEVAEDGLSAVVTLKFTTINIGTVFSTFMVKYFAKAFEMAFSGATEEQMNQMAIDLFLEASNNAPKDKVTTVDVKMVLVDKQWLIHIEEDDITLFDAMMGGLITTMKNFQPVD